MVIYWPPSIRMKINTIGGTSSGTLKIFVISQPKWSLFKMFRHTKSKLSIPCKYVLTDLQSNVLKF